MEIKNSLNTSFEPKQNEPKPLLKNLDNPYDLDVKIQQIYTNNPKKLPESDPCSLSCYNCTGASICQKCN